VAASAKRGTGGSSPFGRTVALPFVAHRHCRSARLCGRQRVRVSALEHRQRAAVPAATPAATGHIALCGCYINCNVRLFCGCVAVQYVRVARLAFSIRLSALLFAEGAVRLGATVTAVAWHGATLSLVLPPLWLACWRCLVFWLLTCCAGR